AHFPPHFCRRLFLWPVLYRLSVSAEYAVFLENLDYDSCNFVFHIFLERSFIHRNQASRGNSEIPSGWAARRWHTEPKSFSKSSHEPTLKARPYSSPEPTVGITYSPVCLASMTGCVLEVRAFSISCVIPVVSNCAVTPGSTSKSIVLCFIMSWIRSWSPPTESPVRSSTTGPMGTSAFAGYDHKTLHRLFVPKPSSSHSMRFSCPSSNLTRRYINLPLPGWLHCPCSRLAKDKKECVPLCMMIKSNLPSDEVSFSTMALPKWSLTFSKRQAR